jgi:hypothetical protein
MSDRFLAHTAGDVPIAEMIRLAPKAVAEMRSRTDLARAAQATGLFEDERQLIQLQRLSKGKLPGRLSGITGAAGKAANWVDSAAKVLVALKRLQDNPGMDSSTAMAEGIQAMGNYNNFGRFEKDLIRRAFPIYPWAKAVGKAVAGYALSHPARTAFILRLGDVAAHSTAQQGLPSWLGGSVPVGGHNYLSVRALFPPTMFAGTPGGFLNPVIKFPIEAGLGLNPNTAKQLSRPGPFGHQPTGHISNPSELEYLALKASPIGQQYLNLFAPAVARYGTGEPVLRRGQPIAYNNPTGVLPRLSALAGLPIQNYTPSPTSTKTAATTAKANQKYAGQLKRLGAKVSIPGIE